MRVQEKNTSLKNGALREKIVRDANSAKSLKNIIVYVAMKIIFHILLQDHGSLFHPYKGTISNSASNFSLGIIKNILAYMYFY